MLEFSRTPVINDNIRKRFFHTIVTNLDLLRWYSLSKPALVSKMSSSPLPSLSELVMKIPPSVSRHSPISPSLKPTPAASITASYVTNSIKSTQVNLSEGIELFKTDELDSASCGIRTIEKLLEKKKTQKKTDGRAIKISRPKKIKKTNFNCAYFEEERNGNRDFEEMDASPLREIRKSQEIRLLNAEDTTTKSVLPSEKNTDALKPVVKSTRKNVKPKPKPGNPLQTRLCKGKVTKLSASLTPDSKSDESICSGQTALKDVNIINATNTFRRRDWTPSASISNTAKIPPSLDLNKFPPLNCSNSEEKSVSLTKLFENFAYSKSENSPSRKKSQVRGPGKRKLIELVKTNSSNLRVPQTKGKALKKKARTLTELATSAYLEDHGIEPPLLNQYVELKTNEESFFPGRYSPENLDIQKPLSDVSSINIQISSLLSPGSAIRQVGAQDLVFGTSSQLARDDSPTFLRDLDESMRASNQSHDPFDSSPRVPTGIKYNTKKQKNLWNAASRDLEGSLLNVELVDLAVSPATTETDTALPFLEDKSNDIDLNSSTNSGLHSNTAKNISPVEIHKYQLLSSSPNCSVTNRSFSIEKGNHLKSNPPSNIPWSSVETHKIPNFESYTNAQLTKELSKYRFKAVKKREQMIFLLQQCWEGKKRMNSGSLSTGTEIIPLKRSTEDGISKIPQCISPKQPKEIRAQSKSLTVSQPKSKADQVNILSDDSGSELYNLSDVRPVRRSKEKPRISGDSPENKLKKKSLKTPPLSSCRIRDNSPLPTVEISPPVLSPAASLRLLYDHIAQAIKDTSHSKEPSNPSWYEKILLYDPIVLEDLTSWLNTGALQKTNWDGEVDLKEVKKWCESKGICCLFRENLKGNARNRY